MSISDSRHVLSIIVTYHELNNFSFRSMIVVSLPHIHTMSDYSSLSNAISARSHIASQAALGSRHQILLRIIAVRLWHMRAKPRKSLSLITSWPDQYQNLALLPLWFIFARLLRSGPCISPRLDIWSVTHALPSLHSSI